jgi:ferredoxin-type protein NapG
VSIAKRQTNRRRVLRTILLTGGVLGAAMSGFLPLVYSQKKRLRPPGALDEKDFLSSCIKCGQCVQVCPVSAIKLADLIDGMGVGVPYIDAREQACDFSCDAVQCVLACPTGSLTYHKPAFLPVRPGAALAAKPILLAKEKDAEPTLNMHERIGVARLVRPEACLAVQGKGFKGQTRGPGLHRQDALHGRRPLEADQGRRPSLRRCRMRSLRPRVSDQGRHFHRNRLRPRRQQAQIAGRP